MMRRINLNTYEPEPCPHCREWRQIAEKAIRATTKMIAVCNRTNKNFDDLDESHRGLQAALEQALAANDRLVAMLRAMNSKGR